MQKKEMSLRQSPSTGICSSQPNLNRCEDGEANVRINTRKRKNTDNEKFDEFCTNIKVILQDFQSKQETKYDNLVKAIDALTLQNTKLIQSNGEIEKILQQSIDQHNELNKKVFALEEECANAYSKINLLEEQLDQVQRNQLKTVLEVRNVPREEKEDLNKIVTKLIRAVDGGVNMDDIRQVYRGGKSNAPIVIEFTNLKHKIQLLKSVTTFNKINKDNKLNCKNLGIESSSITPVYVSEKLTPKTKTLLAAAKQLVKDGLFRYCWVSKGVVLLKKSEDETPIRIEKPKDLEKLQCDDMSK